MRSVIHKILGLCEDAVVFVVMLPFQSVAFCTLVRWVCSEGTQIVKMAAKRYDFAYCERRLRFYLESFGVAYARATFIEHCYGGNDMFEAFEEHNLIINPKHIILVDYEPSTPAHYSEHGDPWRARCLSYGFIPLKALQTTL